MGAGKGNSKRVNVSKKQQNLVAPETKILDGLYYDPNKYGFTLVSEFNIISEPYGYAMANLWQDDKGNLWGAFEDGHSGIEPYGERLFPTDFVELRTKADGESFINQVKEESKIFDTKKDPYKFNDAVRKAIQNLS